jgi:drug/metabolite transporter (DMT)-like permease
MGLAMLAWPVVESLPLLMSRPYPLLEIVWIRYGTHLLLMLLLWAPAGLGRLLPTRRPVLHAVRSATMLGFPLAFLAGRERMSTATVWSVFWLLPLIVLLLARGGLGEHVGRRHVLWALAGVVGAWLLLGSPEVPPRLAWVFPLAMAACFGAYLVLTRALREETVAARLFSTAFGVWLALSAALPWFWRTPTLRDLAVMMGIGVLGFLLLLGVDHALDAAPVTHVAPFLLAQPVWTVLYHAAVRGRAPALGPVVGMVLVVVTWLLLARGQGARKFLGLEGARGRS